MPRSTYYRISKPIEEKPKVPRPKSRRALSADERQQVLDVLHEERFVDKAPAQIYATLLDEGIYLCSISTMYRILHANKEVKERRNQLRHPEHKKPEQLATEPNQLWSWDITKLKGPAKWNAYYLYVILDVFSRYAVGWMIATKQTAELAKILIEETCMRQWIDRDQLIIHSDRGSPMKSKAVAGLLTELGVGKSFNRPYVSNDNPYSESHFKTLKSRPLFPDRLGCIQDARAHCQQFFEWYNNEHYHSGIALMTPATVHYGRSKDCSTERQIILSSAYSQHPERFVKGQPKTIALPEEVWINKPNQPTTITLTEEAWINKPAPPVLQPF
jgi:putative transposase